MALKVGELYVAISASTQQFGKGMQRVLADVEKVAKRLKRFGNDVAQIARPFLIGAVGLVAAAAKTNRAMANQMERLKGLFLTAASEIGMAFLPVVKQIGDGLSRLIAWFQHLSPETKQQIADWIMLGAKVAIGAMVFAKVAAGVAALAEGFSLVVGGLGAVAAVVSGLIVPLLAGAAAIAGVILLTGALKKAWESDFLYMRTIAQYFWDQQFGFVKEFAQIFTAAISNVRAFFVEYLRTFIAGLQRVAAFIPGIGDKIKDALSFADSAIVIGNELVTPEVEDKLGKFVEIAKNVGQAAADGIADSWREGLKALGIDTLLAKLGAAKDKIVGMFSGGGGNPKIVQTLEKQDAAFNQLKNKLVNSLGELGDIFNAASEGLQATGSVFGALGAVVLELLTKSETFRHFVEKVGAVIGVLAEVIGAIAGPILRPLFEVLKAFAQSVIFLFRVVEKIYNAFNFLTGHRLQDIDTTAIDAAQEALAKVTWDSVDATTAATDAMNELADSLTNVPEGFKVAAARYGAQDAVSAPAPAAINPDAGMVPVGVPSAGDTFIFQGITNPDAVAAAVQDVLEARESRRTARSFVGTSRFAQEF